MRLTNQSLRNLCSRLAVMIHANKYRDFHRLLTVQTEDAVPLLLTHPFSWREHPQAYLIEHAAQHPDARFLALVLELSSRFEVRYPGCLVHTLLCRPGILGQHMAVAIRYPAYFPLASHTPCPCMGPGSFPPALAVLINPRITFEAIYTLVEVLFEGFASLLEWSDPLGRLGILQAVVEGGNLETLRLVLTSQHPQLLATLHHNTLLASALRHRDLVLFRSILDSPFLREGLADPAQLLVGLVAELKQQPQRVATSFLCLLLSHPDAAGSYGAAFVASLTAGDLAHPNLAVAGSFLEEPEVFASVMREAFQFATMAPGALIDELPRGADSLLRRVEQHQRSRAVSFSWSLGDPTRGNLTVAHAAFELHRVGGLLPLARLLDPASLLHPINIYHRCILEDDPGILELLRLPQAPTWHSIPVPGLTGSLTRLCLIFNSQRILGQLLQHPPVQFDVNYQDEDGNTLLHYLATEPILHGPLPELVAAIQRKWGVNMNLVNHRGLTPLDHALQQECRWLADILLGDIRCHRSQAAEAYLEQREQEQEQEGGRNYLLPTILQEAFLQVAAGRHKDRSTPIPWDTANQVLLDHLCHQTTC